MKQTRKIYEQVLKTKHYSSEGHNLSELVRGLSITAPQADKWRKDFK
jgi:hypothetical protein